jgi:similar to spore coat protein
MQGNQITPHETFEVHELLMSRTVCANKSAMMISMVQDPQLKTMLTDGLNRDKQQITELKGFLGGSPFNSSGQSMGQNAGQSSQGQAMGQGDYFNKGAATTYGV